MSHVHTETFPRAALVGAGLLLGTTLFVATLVRLTGIDIRSMPAPAASVSRELRFTDQLDGSVLVTDATRGTTVTTLLPGTNGFLRATMRNLAHERRREGLGPQAPFRLFASAEGRLILEDPATGRQIELEAFGPTNAGAFARLLGDSP